MEIKIANNFKYFIVKEKQGVDYLCPWTGSGKGIPSPMKSLMNVSKTPLSLHKPLAGLHRRFAADTQAGFRGRLQALERDAPTAAFAFTVIAA